MKAVLEDQQADAVEAAETAISAIGAVVGFSSHVLTILAIVIGLAAVAGWVVIYNGSRNTAKNVATRQVSAYIPSQVFLDKLDVAIRHEVRERIGGKLILAHINPETVADEPDPFADPSQPT